MKEFDDIHTELPYKESPDYIESLVRKSCENAIRGRKRIELMNAFPYYGLAGLLAAAAIALAVILPFQKKKSYKSPLDNFLTLTSDKEIEMVDEWFLEDIPDCF